MRILLATTSCGIGGTLTAIDNGFPRTMMLTLILLLACVSHILIASVVPNSLYMASIIIGFCVGAQMTLLFTIISELFGLKYYSTLFQVGALGSPVGTYVLNVKVAGQLYDKEARKQLAAKGLKSRAGESLICSGGECYRVSFIRIAASTFFSCLVSLILVYRTVGFYKGDIYRKFREDYPNADDERKNAAIEASSGRSNGQEQA